MNLKLSKNAIVLKRNISFQLELLKNYLSVRAGSRTTSAKSLYFTSSSRLSQVRKPLLELTLTLSNIHSNFSITLLSLFLFSDCIYIQNLKLEQINYPETEFVSGFSPGQNEVNPVYFKEWCKKYCEQIREISQGLGGDYYIEIRGKMDATELPKNRELISLGRANSVRQLLFENGIEETKLKAIADPEPDQYLGKDKFDPKNRTVRFRIRKKDRD